MIVVIILAKAESRRLPGKNMASINGLPLFVHAIRYAVESGISHVIGLQPDHPGRKVPLDDAIRYAIDKEADILLSVHRDGVLSGSFRIYSAEALRGCHHMIAHTMMDDCLNIHTKFDLDM